MTEAPPDRGIDIDAKGVMKMIPHRYPFLMIDRVENAVADGGAVGIKNVSMDEAVFQGHFPTDPVLPGVLIIEAMAQTAAVLVVHTLGEAFHGKLVYFMSIDNARFRRPVVPGDQLRLEVKKDRHRGPVWKFSGVARVGDQVVAEADFAAMIRDA
ncbi:MAG TPA: 3-hydroxyacyl-ACP dehydratase FabZ [Dongiaceae bacterium]|jgi:3-hydroxyacyl-[acyl-carrier-protein] dehydratase|nr:3-hydroxyacyl-ACP dehydratase FabZ [Dongiaceae bacterium]